MQLIYMNAPTGYVAPLQAALTEYPKYIHFPDKRPSVIVNDPEEEAAVLNDEPVAEKPKAPDAPAAPVVSLVGQNDEESMLRKIAAEKGIHIDGRWKLPKIRKAVEAATS